MKNLKLLFIFLKLTPLPTLSWASRIWFLQKCPSPSLRRLRQKDQTLQCEEHHVLPREQGLIPHTGSLALSVSKPKLSEQADTTCIWGSAPTFFHLF